MMNVASVAVEPLNVWLIEDAKQWQLALQQWLPVAAKAAGVPQGVALSFIAEAASEVTEQVERLKTLPPPALVMLDWQLLDGETGLELGSWLEATLPLPAERILFISEAFPEAWTHQQPYRHIPKSQLMRRQSEVLALLAQP